MAQSWASQVTRVLKMVPAVTVGTVGNSQLVADSSGSGSLHASGLQLSSGPAAAAVVAVDQPEAAAAC